LPIEQPLQIITNLNAWSSSLCRTHPKGLQARMRVIRLPLRGTASPPISRLLMRRTKPTH